MYICNYIYIYICMYDFDEGFKRHAKLLQRWRYLGSVRPVRLSDDRKYGRIASRASAPRQGLVTAWESCTPHSSSFSEVFTMSRALNIFELNSMFETLGMPAHRKKMRGGGSVILFSMKHSPLSIFCMERPICSVSKRSSFQMRQWLLLRSLPFHNESSGHFDHLPSQSMSSPRWKKALGSRKSLRIPCGSTLSFCKVSEECFQPVNVARIVTSSRLDGQGSVAPAFSTTQWRALCSRNRVLDCLQQTCTIL